MREAEPFHPRRTRLRGAPPEPARRLVLAPSDYPESDGKPMSETPVHRRATVDATDALEDFYRKRSDVYVGCNMFIYYVEGDPRHNVVPDVWVAFGAPKLPERPTWLIWLEDKGPDFVLEVTSKSTRREDEVSKKKLYEQLDVREYWQFDPTGDYLDPVLKGRILGPNGKYRDLALEERDGTLGHASLLGLELRLQGNRLFFFDPVRNTALLTAAEVRSARRSENAARLKAEEERDQEARLRREEAAARKAAEARVAELERRLGKI